MKKKLVALLLCTVGTTCLVSGQTTFAQTIESNDTVVTSESSTSAKELKEPEEGWKRYQDSDECISYSSDAEKNDTWDGNEVTTLTSTNNTDSEVKFSFTGTKLRLIGISIDGTDMEISFDGGNTFEKCDIAAGMDERDRYDYVVYEKTGLSNEEHNVIIRLPEGWNTIDLNAIDIDEDGKLSDFSMLGKVLEEPESGWKRYQDSDERISYSSDAEKNDTWDGNEVTTLTSTDDTESELKFSFTGTKLRLIGITDESDIEISFDGGNTFEQCKKPTGMDERNIINYVIYEKAGLNNEKHNVIVRLPQGWNTIDLNAIDVVGELN